MSGHDESVKETASTRQMAAEANRATARARSRDMGVSGGERRAARRALVKATLSATLPDGVRAGVATDVLGVPTHQRISDVCNESVGKHVSAADLLAYPEETRVAYAEDLLPGYLLVLRPVAEASDDPSLLASAARESNDVVTCGIVERLGSTRLRREIREAMVALARLDAANEAELTKAVADLSRVRVAKAGR